MAHLLTSLVIVEDWPSSGLSHRLPGTASHSQVLPGSARCCPLLPLAARCCLLLPPAAGCQLLPDAGGLLPDAARRCPTLPEAARCGCSRPLRDAARCCRMLPDAAGCYETLPDACLMLSGISLSDATAAREIAVLQCNRQRRTTISRERTSMNSPEHVLTNRMRG